MCAYHERQQENQEVGYQQNLIPVPWAILVMGISLAVVIGLYVWIGHIGNNMAFHTGQL
jgi:hypothetical protein